MLPRCPFMTEVLTPPTGGVLAANISHIIFKKNLLYLRCITFNAPAETSFKFMPPSWGQPTLSDRGLQGYKGLLSYLHSLTQLSRAITAPLLLRGAHSGLFVTALQLSSSLSPVWPLSCHYYLSQGHFSMILLHSYLHRHLRVCFPGITLEAEG